MSNPQISPMSQLLYSLGMTRDDLSKRSDEMRQFLSTVDAHSSRVPDREGSHKPRSSSELQPGSRPDNSAALLARSASSSTSSNARDASPPTTPVKSEPTEGAVPLRYHDSMEMVIERQRRQSKKDKRVRKDKERDSVAPTMPHPPSPSTASQSGFSLDSFMQSRADRPATSKGEDDAPGNGAVQPAAETVPPITPQRNKYYRDHTILGSGSRKGSFTPRAESITPTRPRAQAIPQNQPQPQYYAYPPYLAYPQYLSMPFNAQASSSAIPVTPRPQRVHTAAQKTMNSPLPSSSPPPASSPFSSPSRRIVNLVSSPGPMGPLPDEDEYDTLPYTLPPGPYSPTKPDLSYAALIGRAILSSPDHRLTLQEIYDWITIVHPHFKRGETTWMNSIRHVLSTTICFRKVPRERSVGRTLWAIWDEDLECFKGGGFRKQLCKDYANSVAVKDRPPGGSKSKSRARKRADGDDDTTPRNAKRAKKDQSSTPRLLAAAPPRPPYILPASLISHPLFPPTRPTPHHQPYYEACLLQPQSIPSEVIFPPLPAGTAYGRIGLATATSSSTPSLSTGESVSDETENQSNDSSNIISKSISSPPLVASSVALSATSVPELTPSGNSSSPPLSQLATSDMDVDVPSNASTKDTYVRTSLVIVDAAGAADPESNDGDGEDGDDTLFNPSSLGPVQFWGESPKNTGGALKPGIDFLRQSEGDDLQPAKPNQGKKKQEKEKAKIKKFPDFPPVPGSPTLSRKAALLPSKISKANAPAPPQPYVDTIPPTTKAGPSTPPRNGSQLNISSRHTPLSHKGLHMSPSASLAHYKSNLDPPPAATFVTKTSNGSPSNVQDPVRTPPRSAGPHPVTPKKLTLASSQESPFQTPLGPLGESPFRTPGYGIFDPHDPRALLDEELSRMGPAGDSPAGLFGKGMGSLLYDSPGALESSPGKWSRWW